MSERASSLFGRALEDALESLNAATPDAFLAVVGARGCKEAIDKIAERAVEALDEGDLVLIVSQQPQILGWTASGWKWRNHRGRANVDAGGRLGVPESIEDRLRAALEDIAVQLLTERLNKRAQEFTAEEPA